MSGDRLAISRRGFLVGAAGLAVSAGCGSGAKGGLSTTTSTPVINVPNPSSTTASNQLSLQKITPLFFTGIDQRLAFVVTGQNGPVTPGPTVTFAIGPDDKHLAPIPVDIHADAAPGPTYLATTRRFTTTGVYIVQVTLDGRQASDAIQVADPASEPSPVPGRTVPNIATPTTANLLDVDQSVLCTRNPVCPWHDISLDKALATGRPLAVIFGTPKYCQSATCGPTLEVLLRQKAAFESKVQFLHLEIYPHPWPNNQQPGTTPPTTATVDAFKISSEPILFLVKPDGTVQQRIDGLFGDAEAKDALTRFTA